MNGGTFKKSLKGSALILTVVLASILASVGVLLLLSSRIEKLSSGAVTDERDLNNAVDTIISKLSNQLILDTPGVAGQEYYDYPGDKDRWLASNEPYNDGGTYKWRQISDLTGYLRDNFGIDNIVQDVDVHPENLSTDDRVREYSEIILDSDGELEPTSADADGDGIADSKWFELDDVMTSDGRKVYAAIRVIDNCGMLNVNTAYYFDRDIKNRNRIDRIDGSALHQVNLAPLGRGTNNGQDGADAIFSVRSNLGTTSPTDDELREYERWGAWRIADPCDEYTLFDVSDELELRYRYLISSQAVTRIENTWGDTIGEGWNELAEQTFNGGSDYGLDDWVKRFGDPCDNINEHDRRHLLTTYSIDRIIAADAGEFTNIEDKGMININYDPCELDWEDGDYAEDSSWREARDFYRRCSKLVDANLPIMTRRRMKRELAQLAVNLVDLRDRDTDVTSLCLSNPDLYEDSADNDFTGLEYVYGLEPHPVITRVAIRLDPNDPKNNINYYAVELFNPFDREIILSGSAYSYNLNVTDFDISIDPNDYDPNDPNTARSRLIASFDLSGGGTPVDLRPGEYIVLYNQPFFDIDPAANPVQFPALRLSDGYRVVRDPRGVPIVDANFVDPHNINISRQVEVRYPTRRTREIYLDRQLIYANWVEWDPTREIRIYGRPFDIETANWWHVVYPRSSEFTSDPNDPNSPATAADVVLGEHDYGTMQDWPAMDIAVPYGPRAGEELRTVGDIARIWSIGPTDRLYDPCDTYDLFDPNAIDVTVEIDPNDPNDVNDTINTRFANFNDYLRTYGEKLRFASSAKEQGVNSDEDFIRLNLADPLYTKLFQYITVFDPRSDNIDNDGDGRTDESNESLKVPGRINVNTAPAYVIAQLPWVTDENGDYDIARAIVDYRDRWGDFDGDNGRYNAVKDELGGQLGYYLWHNYMKDEYDRPGFASIGELNLVADRDRGDDYSIWKYGIEPGPLTRPYFPDLNNEFDYVQYTPPDDRADDDFEERDLIFARISNLATVRSDVFTAYILVRLGTDGPQKRVTAVLDRSDVYSRNDRVKIHAMQTVSYPR